MELFFDLLFTSVCVFIPKCGLFAGLNFEAIRVVLIDVLLLVYLIYVRPYRMDHYKSPVIILNAQLRSKPASFTWKLTRTAFFCLPFFACLFEKATVSECLSHCPLTSRSCLKRCSSQLLEAAQSELDALSRLENVLSFVLLTQVISRNCHTGGFALSAPVYPSTLKCLLKCHDNIILGPESSWQKSKHCLYTYLMWWYPSSKKTNNLSNNKAPFVGSLFFLSCIAKLCECWERGLRNVLGDYWIFL